MQLEDEQIMLLVRSGEVARLEELFDRHHRALFHYFLHATSNRSASEDGAQDNTTNRIVVPARNSSHPRVVNRNIFSGSISVKTHAGADVILEEPSSAPIPRRARGIKRLDSPIPGLEVAEEDNVITVRNRLRHLANFIITVPAGTSLRLKMSSGAITVDGVSGEVSAHCLSGRITLNHISGAVTADTLNGPIRSEERRVERV